MSIPSSRATLGLIESAVPKISGFFWGVTGSHGTSQMHQSEIIEQNQRHLALCFLIRQKVILVHQDDDLVRLGGVVDASMDRLVSRRSPEHIGFIIGTSSDRSPPPLCGPLSETHRS
jgi:hypothetical protein